MLPAVIQTSASAHSPGRAKPGPGSKANLRLRLRLRPTGPRGGAPIAQAVRLSLSSWWLSCARLASC